MSYILYASRAMSHTWWRKPARCRAQTHIELSRAVFAWYQGSTKVPMVRGSWILTSEVQQKEINTNSHHFLLRITYSTLEDVRVKTFT
jgi:hypothetical protein